MNRWIAGRVVRVQGTVAKIRVGISLAKMRGRRLIFGQEPCHERYAHAFEYLDFGLRGRTPRIGEFVCERIVTETISSSTVVLCSSAAPTSIVLEALGPAVVLPGGATS